jgi:hypothetical protein
MAAHQSILTLCGMNLGISIQIIETALFDASGLRVKREMIGSFAGDKIIDINKQHVVHKLITLIVYGGVGFLSVGFTAYALYLASEAVKENVALVHVPVIAMATVFYSLLACMVGLSWIVGFRLIGKSLAGLKEQQAISSVEHIQAKP